MFILLTMHRQSIPKFFTFRAVDNYAEDEIYRHLEPACAFQLELSRLQYYKLTKIQTANRKLHMYFGISKVHEDDAQNLFDGRYFIRTIIRHSDLITKKASAEYLQMELERAIVDALEELEIRLLYDPPNCTDCNHIFLNVIPQVVIELCEVDAVISNIVHRYGTRFWKLRILSAEVKLNVRQASHECVESIRICVSNESGYLLEIALYKEVLDTETGKVRLKS